MSLSSPHHEQPAIFDLDLEIDCESSGSLNTSFYDSESESETKIGKKLRLRGDSPVTGKFSSDSAQSDLESEEEALSEEKEESSSEEKEESSSDSPDSSSDDNDPPPTKRYRLSPDKLAPKQHRIIVTRKRLTFEHLNLLKSRNLLPDTQDTDNDSVSECETTVQEEREIEEKELKEQDENEKKAVEAEPSRTLLPVEEENSTFGGSEPIFSSDLPKEDKLGVFDSDQPKEDKLGVFDPDQPKEDKLGVFDPDQPKEDKLDVFDWQDEESSSSHVSATGNGKGNTLKVNFKTPSSSLLQRSGNFQKF
ncbi:myb-like protein X [Bolinopsis microptera]|uniref:myb-like protein X n=1 Tax=Bolinopsis microptera TaxID=2820187 RepID=UPI003079BCF5